MRGVPLQTVHSRHIVGDPEERNVVGSCPIRPCVVGRIQVIFREFGSKNSVLLQGSDTFSVDG